MMARHCQTPEIETYLDLLTVNDPLEASTSFRGSRVSGDTNGERLNTSVCCRFSTTGFEVEPSDATFNSKFESGFDPSRDPIKKQF